MHLKPPQPTDVSAAFKAHGLQSLIQAAFDTGQAWTSSSHHGHTTSHAAAAAAWTIH